MMRELLLIFNAVFDRSSPILLIRLCRSEIKYNFLRVIMYDSWPSDIWIAKVTYYIFINSFAEEG